MAWALPKASFIGVDLAKEPIGRGQKIIDQLGISNVRLITASASEIDPTWGKFDYIIAHGLYSWVPSEVREHIMRLCRECLAPEGVAFVSYNAMPGCHLRAMTREMMQFHIRGLTSPEEQIAQARALLHFLATTDCKADDEYRVWLKAELGRVLRHDDGHFFHDDLAEINDPFYFTQFMAKAESHGLQYLGEADFQEMSDHLTAQGGGEALQRLSTHRIIREQYVDFLKCRRFRQTLLCHREAKLLEKPDWRAVAGFWVSSAAAIQSTPVGAPHSEKAIFKTPRGAKFETDLPVGKVAILQLGRTCPTPSSFGQLLHCAALPGECVSNQDPVGPTAEPLAKFLLQLYSAGFVDFHTIPNAAISAVTERPVASELARWQAAHGTTVTSLLHVPVCIEDEIGRQLLQWLDGTRDHRQLLDCLCAFLHSHNVAVPEPNEGASWQKLASDLEENLLKLARFGFLVG